MKRLRLALLGMTLLVVLIALYYQRQNTVRVETVWLQSKAIGKPLPYNVVLPRGYGLLTGSGLHYPVLYLLHGHNGHYDSWESQTGLTRYVSDLKMIVVTPEGENGWYTDSATVDAEKYETFLVKELIPDVESRFRVIPERRGRAIAGCSMGGYGALKFGLKYPELFAFAGSMSGAFDAPLRIDDDSIMQTFGPQGSSARDANNLAKLTMQLSPMGISALPYLYFCCGRDDPWVRTNRDFAKLLDSQGIKHCYREVTGVHDWSFWDTQLPDELHLAASIMTSPRP